MGACLLSRDREMECGENTLNRVPIEENFDDLADSSDEVGNKLATNEHSEALKSA